MFKGPRIAVFTIGIFAFLAGFACSMGLPLMLLFQKLPRDSGCGDLVKKCVEEFDTPTGDIDLRQSCAFLTTTGISGLSANDLQSLTCANPSLALFPPFGLALSLYTSYVSYIEVSVLGDDSFPLAFTAALSNAADEVVCDGNACSVPFVEERARAYGGNALVGSALFLLAGIVVTYLAKFPPEWFNSLKKKLVSVCSIAAISSLIGSKSTAHQNTINQEDQEQDVDVKEESEYVVNAMSGSIDSLPPILMNKLTKIYPSHGGLPPKVACKDLDLHVEAGQMLGLLGPNGAGKTTAVKILAGSHPATSGDALVCSHNVETDPSGVFRSLGNCPQFEVVWPHVTVYNHLLFYARLKGLPGRNVKGAMRKLAEVVGLGSTKVLHRQARHLSGGMRRRLAIAIALIGAPDVVLLDEPTTGLDPMTRHNIWDLIRAFSDTKRSFIITTHMMTEADTLCDRIAIMARGTLRVVGTQQRLKDRFGNGYTLVLTVLDNHDEEVLEFIQANIHKGAHIEFRSGKTMRITLPDEGLRLDRVFRSLQSKAAISSGITQWLLNQSSLEDVFINVAENAL